MRLAKLLTCLLALILASRPSAEPLPEGLTEIAQRIREHFPRLEMSAFSCVELTCSKKIDFVWFNVIVTLGADAQPIAIAAVTDPPKAASGDLRELFDTAFKECAVAIVSLAVPDVSWDERVALAIRAISASGARVGHGDWTFASRTTPLGLKIVEAKRE
jgi:hypothetical protein